MVITLAFDVCANSSNLSNYRRARRALSSVELRRAARKPWRRMPYPVNPLHLQRAGRQDDMVVILD